MVKKKKLKDFFLQKVQKPSKFFSLSLVPWLHFKALINAEL